MSTFTRTTVKHDGPFIANHVHMFELLQLKLMIQGTMCDNCRNRELMQIPTCLAIQTHARAHIETILNE